MNNPGANHHKIILADLIEISALQTIQNNFADAANVSIRTVDTKGRLITNISNEPSLCIDDLRDANVKEKLCHGCLPAFLGGEGVIDDDFGFECISGLRSYLVPLKVMLTDTNSLIVGYMVVGPVIFMKRKARDEFDAVAMELGLDPDQLWNHILELKVFSYQGIRSLLDMITNLTSSILTLSYSKLAMQRRAHHVNSDRGAKDAIPMDKFLMVFLDLIINMINGSKGSIMLLDQEKKDLVIKAAHGLPREIISGPSLRVGDGIAGLAVKTKKSFLINQDAVDESISGRLKRPNLFSSMVVPIKYDDDVFGVVNVSSGVDSPVRFNENNLAFVTKVAGLAGVALSHLEN